MLQMSVLTSNYNRVENMRLDHTVERYYQKNLPACTNEMFGTFLLDENPTLLAAQTPINHVTFHLRVPILTLAVAQMTFNRSVAIKYNLPDINWHLHSRNKHYNQSMQRWMDWVRASDANYEWMREVLFELVGILESMKAYTDDNKGVVSSIVNLVKREPAVSLQKFEGLTTFPFSVRTSRAKLIANRWMFAQFKGKKPAWWPYPTGLLNQDHIDRIDKIKLKLVNSKKVLVLDAVPDVAFAPPPNTVLDSKRNNWDSYDWRGLTKAKGNWHRVYDYDFRWLQRHLK